METLTLADGTVLDGHCIESTDTLWLYLNNTTLTETFPELSVRENVQTITANQYGEVKTYIGFSHLFCIREEGGGLVSAGLKKT